MSGPLEREFTQVREALHATHRAAPSMPLQNKLEDAASALSAIERHVQEQGELLERLLDYGASGYQEALARRSAWVSSQPAALPARDTEIYGTKADRDGDLRHYAPDARRGESVMGLRDILDAATPDDNYAGYGEILEALERERDEWRALALDMGEALQASYRGPAGWDENKDALLARLLDQLCVREEQA